MPTIKRREWVSAPLPPDIKPDDDVFVVKLTGEVFKHYKDYNAQMSEYRSRHWACKYTGKQGLTLEEAFQEEKKSTDLLKEVRESLNPMETTK